MGPHTLPCFKTIVAGNGSATSYAIYIGIKKYMTNYWVSQHTKVSIVNPPLLRAYHTNHPTTRVFSHPNLSKIQNRKVESQQRKPI